MSSAKTLVTKEDLNYAAQVQKSIFAVKGDIPSDYIVSGSQTSTSSEDGGSNVFTFTKKDGSQSTFTVKNGSKGEAGEAGDSGVRGSMIFWGTAITGTSEIAVVFSGSSITCALINDLYINTSTWNIYQCTIGGAASVAKWSYKGNIKGASGETAQTGSVSVAGLTKLYDSTGTSTDGTMTRNAITNELTKYIKKDDIKEIEESEIDAMYASV